MWPHRVSRVDVSNGHYWTSGYSTRTPAPTANSPSQPPTGSMRPRKGARTKNASGKLNTRLFLPLCSALPAATASPPPLFSSVSPLCSPTRERSPSPHFLPLLGQGFPFLLFVPPMPASVVTAGHGLKMPARESLTLMLLWSLLLQSAFGNYPWCVWLLFCFSTPPPPTFS